MSVRADILPNHDSSCVLVYFRFPASVLRSPHSTCMPYPRRQHSPWARIKLLYKTHASNWRARINGRSRTKTSSYIVVIFSRHFQSGPRTSNMCWIVGAGFVFRLFNFQGTPEKKKPKLLLRHQEDFLLTFLRISWCLHRCKSTIQPELYGKGTILLPYRTVNTGLNFINVA